MWKQRVWPKYKPMLWYFKRSGNGNSQGPTMYSDIEDLIESQPADKTMHEWEQSTIEAERIVQRCLHTNGRLASEKLHSQQNDAMIKIDLVIPEV